MDSMKIKKIMVLCGLSMDSKNRIWVCLLPKKNPWNPWNIHGIRESTRTPQGLPGGVISPHGLGRSTVVAVACNGDGGGGGGGG